MNQRDLIASAIQGKHIPCSKPDTAMQIDMRATRNRFNPSMTVSESRALGSAQETAEHLLLSCQDGKPNVSGVSVNPKTP